jgi:hypothetical protein
MRELKVEGEVEGPAVVGVSGETGGERNCSFTPLIEDFLCDSDAEGEERSSAVGKRS